MSMSIVLEATAMHLRTVLELEITQCDIQPRCEPPPIAPQWYIGIDDGGVDQKVRPSDDLLIEEIYTVEVGIWMKPGQFPKDRQKELLKGKSRYKLDCETVDSLERRVLWAMLGKQADKTLSNRQLWRKMANEVIGQIPQEGRGDEIRLPLLYQGRNKNEPLFIPGQTDVTEWFGRRLRFKGGDRTQYVEEFR